MLVQSRTSSVSTDRRVQFVGGLVWPMERNWGILSDPRTRGHRWQQPCHNLLQEWSKFDHGSKAASTHNWDLSRRWNHKLQNPVAMRLDERTWCKELHQKPNWIQDTHSIAIPSSS